MATWSTRQASAYVWVENRAAFNLDAIKRSIDRFTMSRIPEVGLGSEWTPGVDADPRLHVSIRTRWAAVWRAIYYSADEYSRLAKCFLPRKEMFTSIWLPRPGSDYTEGETGRSRIPAHDPLANGPRRRYLDQRGSERICAAGRPISASVRSVNGFAANPDLQLQLGSLSGRQRPALRQRLSVYRLPWPQRFGQDFLATLVAEPAMAWPASAALKSAGSLGDRRAGFCCWVTATTSTNRTHRPTVSTLTGPADSAFAPASFTISIPVNHSRGRSSLRTDYIDLRGQWTVTFQFDGAA